jgi:hypothetical protein
MTVHGAVGDIFPNKAGSWTIGVAHGNGRPCWQDMHAPVILSEARPPAACRKGAALTATVVVSYDDIFDMADQKKLIRLSCE